MTPPPEAMQVLRSNGDRCIVQKLEGVSRGQTMSMWTEFPRACSTQASMAELSRATTTLVVIKYHIPIG